jgi:cytoskeletal protein CcmA (bactofilin family)
MENSFFGAAKRSAVREDVINDAGSESSDSLRSVRPTPESEATADALLSEDRGTANQLSTIGRTLVFKGELDAAEDLLILGRVQGSINHTGSNLTIGADGNVKADINAQRVIVQGTMQGDIRASESITVEPSANVKGNLFAPNIALKEGARFKGSIDMEDAPVGQSAQKANGAEAGKKAKSDSGNVADTQGEDRALSDQKVDALLD